MKKSLIYLSIVIFFSCGSDGDVAPQGRNNVSTGGSMARFTISGDYLYSVDNSRLITFSLEDVINPSKVDQFELDWGVETIFAMDTVIFVGTQTGMHMFDISEGSRPGYLAGYEHIQSCDPVVAQDTLAFVTLRSDNSCRNGLDRLDVINIKNLKDPQLLASYPMQNPHGLAVRDSLLFVCEGLYGMKVFAIDDSTNLKEIKHYPSMRSKDVILKDEQLMLLIADDGIFQYDYSDIRNIQLLSQIKIEYE